MVTAEMNTPATELARLMRDEEVGSVVVVSGGQPVGVVTDRDLVVYVLAVEANPRERTARDLMAEDVFTVEAETDPFTVMRKMRDAGVRRVPITDDGELVGIVTLDDLVVVLANELGNLAGVVESEMPHAG